MRRCFKSLHLALKMLIVSLKIIIYPCSTHIIYFIGRWAISHQTIFYLAGSCNKYFYTVLPGYYAESEL